MERDDRYYNSGNNYEGDNRRQRHNNAGDKLSNYQTRYESHGNYYGMPNAQQTYQDVRAAHGPLHGNNTSGPVGGYGASSYRGASDQGNQGRWEEQNRTHRNEGDRESRHYNYGSGHQSTSGHRNRDNHYRYGDPNPYMGGYEQTRGTGWDRDSSGAYRGSTSTNDNSRYARQDNSYQSSGQGRRYSDFGRDEQRSYNPGNVDAYYDRSDFNRSSSDNDFRGYRPQQNRFYDSDARRHVELQQGEIRTTRSSQDEIRDQDYTKHENRYRSGSEERRHRSGPNYNASSSASSYTDSGSIR
ncbi:hypothetical protein [Pontibacter liquoris]|uniref:hypothetical protein n=1 Tax=Pontibacter liquoris TaxID=2905677 RepID=UPI001FA74B80|nr:hypothetical protein [Pontibacter liquoris]